MDMMVKEAEHSLPDTDGGGNGGAASSEPRPRADQAGGRAAGHPPRAAHHPRRRSMRRAPRPDEAEVARLIAEFHARGGQVTVCGTAHALPIQNGAGRDATRWTP